jgi:hypothetical protein
MARPPISKTRPYTPRAGRFAGRTFRTEREYRDALAQAKGYMGWDDQRAQVRAVGDMAAYERLRPSERAAYDKAGSVLTLMRTGQHLEPAAKSVGTTPASVRRYAGEWLQRDLSGRYRAAPTDGLIRRLNLVTASGIEQVTVTDSRTASRVAAYDSALGRWLDGDRRALDAFSGESISVVGQRLPFLTDPAILVELARRGEVRFESIYASAA